MANTDEPADGPRHAEGILMVHTAAVQRWLAMPAGIERGAEITNYISWLDSCRQDASAFRLIDVHTAYKADGVGYGIIAQAFGVQRPRIQQMVKTINDVTLAAATSRVSGLRRKLRGA